MQAQDLDPEPCLSRESKEEAATHHREWCPSCEYDMTSTTADLIGVESSSRAAARKRGQQQSLDAQEACAFLASIGNPHPAGSSDRYQNIQINNI